jgi:MFS family permease
LWVGSTVSAIGSQLSVVAVAYEIYHLTRSDLDVGLVSLIQLVPSLLGSFIGGSIADAMDRRKLLALTGCVMAALAVGMALDVDRAHPSVIVLFVLAAAASGVQALNGPAQTAVLLSIVERDMMVKANALRQLSNQVASVLGPTLAGVLIAGVGTKVAFFGNAASFLVSVVAVLGVGTRTPVGGTTRFGWSSIVEGFKFLQSRPAIKGCLIADFNAMVLGMPTALFPAMAATHFHGGPRIVGLLYAAPGLGAVVGATVSGWTSRVQRPGLAICVFGVVWGLAIIAFGLSPWAWIAVLCLTIAGAADIIAAIFRGTIIQTDTPDRLRGRLTSIQLAVVGNGPRLGNTEAGLVASATSTQFSVISGGIGCVVGIALIARLLPRFVHYEIPTGEEVIESP